MENWQIFLGIGGIMTPVVLAAMARDRSLISMFTTMETGLEQRIKAETAPLHERVNRVRDEYVRRDDLEAHLSRMEKQFDEVRAELRRTSETNEKRLAEILTLLRKVS